MSSNNSSPLIREEPANYPQFAEHYERQHVSEVTELRDAVESLTDEVKLLRQVLDEVREELSWANNNAQDLPEGRGATSTFRHITSMSLDPNASDFEINSVNDETVSRLREEATARSNGNGNGKASQTTLF